jgi:hypothetical protein
MITAIDKHPEESEHKVIELNILFQLPVTGASQIFSTGTGFIAGTVYIFPKFRPGSVFLDRILITIFRCLFVGFANPFYHPLLGNFIVHLDLRNPMLIIS